MSALANDRQALKAPLRRRFAFLHDAMTVPATERGHMSALAPRATPFPALELGPLLGRGSYGRVYRGKHLGRPVAVKVGLLTQTNPS